MPYHPVTVLAPALVVHTGYMCKWAMMLKSQGLFILGTSLKHNDKMSLGLLPLKCWYASHKIRDLTISPLVSLPLPIKGKIRIRVFPLTFLVTRHSFPSDQELFCGWSSF